MEGGGMVGSLGVFATVGVIACLGAGLLGAGVL